MSDPQVQTLRNKESKETKISNELECCPFSQQKEPLRGSNGNDSPCIMNIWVMGLNLLVLNSMSTKQPSKYNLASTQLIFRRRTH